MPGGGRHLRRAAIWHDFMPPAHGVHCDDFPPPTEPAQFSPFFGKYAPTGSPAPANRHQMGTTRRSTTRGWQMDKAPLDQPNGTPPEEVQPQEPGPGSRERNGNGAAREAGTAAPG